MRRIGPNHGIDATRKFLRQIIVSAPTQWERLFSKPDEPTSLGEPLEGTLYKLVEGHNELTDGNVLGRVSELERRVAALEGSGPTGPTGPTGPPPPPGKYAPRAYNTAPNGSDARFCMDAKYGTVREGSGYRDAMGVTYDEGGRDLGGRTKFMVPGLKTADMMDDKGVCDPYEWQGNWFGGDYGYPPESFER